MALSNCSILRGEGRGCSVLWSLIGNNTNPVGRRDKVRGGGREGGREGARQRAGDGESCLLLDVASRNLTFYGNTGLLL
jgi:hypothetical protein